MSKRRILEPGPRPGPEDPGGPGTAAWILLVVAFVGGLTWTVAEPSENVQLLIENPTADVRSVDVVWRAPGGKVSGSLVRVLEPAGLLKHSLRVGSTACVRWIDEGRALVEAGRPIRAHPDAGTLVVRPPPSSAGPFVSRSLCPPELTSHPIRPRLGRWMAPGQPHRTFRERIIPRVLPRRQARRRNSGKPGGARSWRAWLSPRAGPRGHRRLTYWHLTPRGWVRGGWRTPGAEHPDRPPADRVMTCLFAERRPSRFVSPTRRLSSTWIGCPAEARRLQRRFGRCPRMHDRPEPRIRRA